MPFISALLDTTLGPKQPPASRPQWMSDVREDLKQINDSYHPGRILNCLAVSVRIIELLVQENKNLSIKAPTFSLNPCFSQRYFRNIHQWMYTLDPNLLKGNPLPNIELGFNELSRVINQYEIQPFTPFLLCCRLKKIFGAGHALCGIVVPDEKTDGVKLFLFDAHGLVPETWLEPTIFSKYYQIETFYFFISQNSRNNTQKYLNQFASFCSTANQKLIGTIVPPTSKHPRKRQYQKL